MRRLISAMARSRRSSRYKRSPRKTPSRSARPRGRIAKAPIAARKAISSRRSRKLGVGGGVSSGDDAASADASARDMRRPLAGWDPLTLVLSLRERELPRRRTRRRLRSLSPSARRRPRRRSCRYFSIAFSARLSSPCWRGHLEQLVADPGDVPLLVVGDFLEDLERLRVGIVALDVLHVARRTSALRRPPSEPASRACERGTVRRPTRFW